MTTRDRWFLDRVATYILAWEGTEADPAQGYWFEGNFAGYEQNKYEQNKVVRLGAEAALPHRVTHRGLTRDRRSETIDTVRAVLLAATSSVPNRWRR